MSIRSWAYNEFADRNKAVNDDYIIGKIKKILKKKAACYSTDEISTETIQRWLDDGMTTGEYHLLYLMSNRSKNGEVSGVENLNPKIIRENTG